MGNCLVTKLKGIVDNDSLIPLGAMKVRINPISAIMHEYANCLKVQVNDTIRVVSKGGKFGLHPNSFTDTDREFSANPGTYYFFFENTSTAYDVFIYNKYAITSFEISPGVAANVERSVSADLSTIAGLTALTTFSISNTLSEGDISGFKASSNLTLFIIDGTNAQGHLSAFSNKASLTALAMGNTRVSGNISEIAASHNIATLNVSNTFVTGTVEQIVSQHPNMNALYLYNTAITGSINSLSACTNLRHAYFGGTQVGGSIEGFARPLVGVVPAGTVIKVGANGIITLTDGGEIYTGSTITFSSDNYVVS